MPRIANLGDLDWDLSPVGTMGHFYACEHLCLRLLFDTGLGATVTKSYAEMITFCGPQSGITPGYNTKINGTILEEDSELTPSRAREFGRFLAKESPSAFNVSVICGSEDRRMARYVINQVNEVEYPTKFINSIARKANKWVKSVGLDHHHLIVHDKEVLERGTMMRTLDERDGECVEKLVLRLKRETGQRIEWTRNLNTSGTDFYRPVIYAIGNLNHIEQRLNRFFG